MNVPKDLQRLHEEVEQLGCVCEDASLPDQAKRAMEIAMDISRLATNVAIEVVKSQ